MTQSSLSDTQQIDNEKAIEELCFALGLARRTFRLHLACCNYESLREEMVQKLREQYPEIREIVVSPSETKLYSLIRENLQDESIPALMVLGLENVENIDRLFRIMNPLREEFRKNCSFPIILWMSARLITQFIRLAPDFESWTTRVRFEIAPDRLVQNLDEKAELLFTRVTDFGDRHIIPNRLLFSQNHYLEIQAALQDLEKYQQTLSPLLQASIHFAHGRRAYFQNRLTEALQNYQDSLQFWQESDRKEREGIVLFHIGLCYERKAERDRRQQEIYWQQAKDYFQQCIDCFDFVGRKDLTAKFIGQLGDVLRRLQDWSSLKTVAEKSRQLHEKYENSLQLSRDSSFLAEVVFHENEPNTAKELAEKALEFLENEPEREHYLLLPLLLLARSQRQLGEVQAAIANLESAKAIDPAKNPPVYIDILAELRSLYYEEARYLDAYKIKLERRAIAYQFGFLAFIGAGRLQSSVQTISETEEEGGIAREILASGRGQNIKHLIERISNTQHKLTVIYGQSGVGKSSLVNAGLVPSLQNQIIGTLDVLPIPLRVYTNWIDKLGQLLVEALKKQGIFTSVALNSVEKIVTELEENEKRDFQTVLIFDQFEEFFFVCQELEQRQQFFDFLGRVIKIKTVKVVLSLREDYLHYLLNCTRITDLSAINNDILSKNILYHLGNFSPEDAKEVIASLTERSQFHLESELVEAIVQELSEELREVRPIELQVVGAQMQAEGITTLEQYREFGTKEKLVERYLADVVKDCGEENKKLAEDILYLLTDENNTRPLKTRPELEAELKTLAADLKIEEARLTLILEIFVKSSLVFLLPENPCDRYQIFHDYLVAFIRKQRDFGLSAELKKEREKRQQSEAELNKVLKQQLKIAIGGGVLMTGLAILAGLFGIQANIGKTNAEVKEISAAAESLFASRKELDSLVEGLRAGKKLQQEVLKFGIEDNTKNQVIARLQEIVYGTNEINRLEGHSDTVKDIIFSPNGKFIASGGKDKKVILWNKSGEKIAELENHYKSITTLVFSPDSKILASGSEDNTIKLWSIKGEELKTLEGHSDKINQISFSPDGKTIASASSDGTVKLWNQDGSLVNTLTDHNSDVTLVQFSPNGKIIATVGKDDTIKLRTRNGNLRHSIGSFGVLKIKFQENSKILMGVSQDKTLKFWDLDGNLLKTTHEILWNAPSVINFSENAQKLVASDPWGQTHFWKIEDFNVEHLDYLLQSHPQNGTLSPDGNILAWVSRDNVIQTYNLDNQHFKTKEDERDRGNIIGFNLENLPVSIRDRTIKFWNLDGKLVKTIELSDPLEHLLFSPNGQTIVSAIVEAPAKLFNTVDGSLVKAFDKDILFSEFSPDGQLFVTTSWDNTAKLWKSDGKPIKLLEGHSDRITTVVFSPDSQIFATASQDKTAKLWNRNGKLIKTLKGHGDRIEKIVFSRDSQRIATTSRDNTVKLWDHKGQSIQTIDNYSYNHKEQWTRRETQIPHFSPDGQILFVPSHYNNVKLWDRDGKILTILKENDSPVFHTSFSPDSQTIATLNRNGTIKLWNRDGSLVKTIEGEHYGNVIAFSPDSQLIVSVVQSKVKLWTREGKLIKTLTGSASNIQFSPDSQTILSITGNDAILWNRQGQLIKIIKKYGDETPAISFNSKTGLLASTDRNNTIKLWNSKGKLIKTLTGHQAEITQLTFSKDGKTFISMDKENIVKTWRSNNGELLQAIKGHGYEGGRASLSNDGKTIAIFGFEDKIKLWDNEGNLLKTFKGHTDQIQSISLSLDNQLLASASKDKTVKLWNLDGTEIQTLEGHTKPVNSVSFSPDGKFLASASEDKTVKLWNRQGKLIDTLEGHRNSVREVRFSPNSQIVVSASDDNTIRLWDVRTKKELKILRGHSDSVTSIRFSQNGKTIASTSQDGDVKIWSNTGIMLMNFGWNSLRGNDINFSPDGKKIIAFGQEETLIWSLELDELLKLGCNKARDYLKTNPSVKESDRNLCDDIE